MVVVLNIKKNAGVKVDRPMTSADAQPMKVTTIPHSCGGRLRRTSVLKVWMPIVAMKKNDPNCPINFNDPSGETRRGGQHLQTDERPKCRTLSDASRSYKTIHEGWMV